MYIPIGLLYAIIPVLLTGFFAFVTWFVRSINKHAQLLASVATELGSHEDRLKRLEGWYDGVQYGRATAHMQP